MSAPRPDLSARALTVWLVAATGLGAGLRAAGLTTDLWLDEIWTWAMAAELSSPLGVFTGLHHSNNHHLLTLWYQALGPDASPVLLRLPSFVAGVATVPLVAAVARPAGRLAAALAASLAALSFALVHFSSEARGYAIAVACALSAQLALDRSARRPSAAWAFAGAISVGLLAHLVVAFYWLGAAVLSARRLRDARPGEMLRRALALHGLPLAVLAALFAVDLRHLVVGGGNVTDLPALLARLVGFSFGLPVVRGLGPALAAVAVLAIAAALAARARRGDDRWISDGIQILVAPPLVFAVFQPEVIAVRYFLVALAFALALLAEPLAAGWRRGGAARAAAVASLLVFAAGSVRHDLAFVAWGRGGYAEAVRTMAAHDPDRIIEVGSDHDFRTGLTLRYHARALPEGTRLVYRRRSEWPPGGPDWLVVHRPQRPARPALEIGVPGGGRYRLVAEFDHAAISGFYWALYRNERLPPVSEPRAPRGGGAEAGGDAEGAARRDREGAGGPAVPPAASAPR